MPEQSYVVTVDGRPTTVTLRRDGSAVFVRLDEGEEQPAQLRRVHGLVHALTVGDRTLELLARESRRQTRIALRGRNFEVEAQDA
ncbi:hypothetical protein NL533_32300, partial [Klebsiella pneumoniae]|nr:hypothetical protein [Klebsiella pneumoniae]